jgi:hypothetical protein
MPVYCPTHALGSETAGHVVFPYALKCRYSNMAGVSAWTSGLAKAACFSAPRASLRANQLGKASNVGRELQLRREGPDVRDLSVIQMHLRR